MQKQYEQNGGSGGSIDYFKVNGNSIGIHSEFLIDGPKGSIMNSIPRGIQITSPKVQTFDQNLQFDYKSNKNDKSDYFLTQVNAESKEEFKKRLQELEQNDISDCASYNLHTYNDTLIKNTIQQISIIKLDPCIEHLQSRNSEIQNDQYHLDQNRKTRKRNDSLLENTSQDDGSSKFTPSSKIGLCNDNIDGAIVLQHNGHLKQIKPSQIQNIDISFTKNKAQKYQNEQNIEIVQVKKQIKININQENDPNLGNSQIQKSNQIKIEQNLQQIRNLRSNLRIEACTLVKQEKCANQFELETTQKVQIVKNQQFFQNNQYNQCEQTIKNNKNNYFNDQIVNDIQKDTLNSNFQSTGGQKTIEKLLESTAELDQFIKMNLVQNTDNLNQKRAEALQSAMMNNIQSMIQEEDDVHKCYIDFERKHAEIDSKLNFKKKELIDYLSQKNKNLKLLKLQKSDLENKLSSINVHQKQEIEFYQNKIENLNSNSNQLKKLLKNKLTCLKDQLSQKNFLLDEIQTVNDTKKLENLTNLSIENEKQQIQVQKDLLEYKLKKTQNLIVQNQERIQMLREDLQQNEILKIKLVFEMEEFEQYMSYNETNVSPQQVRRNNFQLENSSSQSDQVSCSSNRDNHIIQKNSDQFIISKILAQGNGKINNQNLYLALINLKQQKILQNLIRELQQYMLSCNSGTTDTSIVNSDKLDNLSLLISQNSISHKNAVKSICEFAQQKVSFRLNQNQILDKIEAVKTSFNSKQVDILVNQIISQRCKLDSLVKRIQQISKKINQELEPQILVLEETQSQLLFQNQEKIQNEILIRMEYDQKLQKKNIISNIQTQQNYIVQNQENQVQTQLKIILTEINSSETEIKELYDQKQQIDHLLNEDINQKQILENKRLAEKEKICVQIKKLENFDQLLESDQNNDPRATELKQQILQIKNDKEEALNFVSYEKRRYESIVESLRHAKIIANEKTTLKAQITTLKQQENEIQQSQGLLSQCVYGLTQSSRISNIQDQSLNLIHGKILSPSSKKKGQQLKKIESLQQIIPIYENEITQITQSSQSTQSLHTSSQTFLNASYAKYHDLLNQNLKVRLSQDTQSQINNEKLRNFCQNDTETVSLLKEQSKEVLNFENQQNKFIQDIFHSKFTYQSNKIQNQDYATLLKLDQDQFQVRQENQKKIEIKDQNIKQKRIKSLQNSSNQEANKLQNFTDSITSTFKNQISQHILDNEIKRHARNKNYLQNGCSNLGSNTVQTTQGLAYMNSTSVIDDDQLNLKSLKSANNSALNSSKQLQNQQSITNDERAKVFQDQNKEQNQINKADNKLSKLGFKINIPIQKEKYNHHSSLTQNSTINLFKLAASHGIENFKLESLGKTQKNENKKIYDPYSKITDDIVGNYTAMNFYNEGIKKMDSQYEQQQKIEQPISQAQNGSLAAQISECSAINLSIRNTPIEIQNQVQKSIYKAQNQSSTRYPQQNSQIRGGYQKQTFSSKMRENNKSMQIISHPQHKLPGVNIQQHKRRHSNSQPRSTNKNLRSQKSHYRVLSSSKYSIKQSVNSLSQNSYHARKLSDNQIAKQSQCNVQSSQQMNINDLRNMNELQLDQSLIALSNLNYQRQKSINQNSQLQKSIVNKQRQSLQEVPKYINEIVMKSSTQKMQMIQSSQSNNHIFQQLNSKMDQKVCEPIYYPHNQSINAINDVQNQSLLTNQPHYYSQARNYAQNLKVIDKAAQNQQEYLKIDHEKCPQIHSLSQEGNFSGGKRIKSSLNGSNQINILLLGCKPKQKNRSRSAISLFNSQQLQLQNAFIQKQQNLYQLGLQKHREMNNSYDYQSDMLPQQTNQEQQKYLLNLSCRDECNDHRLNQRAQQLVLMNKSKQIINNKNFRSVDRKMFRQNQLSTVQTSRQNNKSWVQNQTQQRIKGANRSSHSRSPVMDQSILKNVVDIINLPNQSAQSNQTTQQIVQNTPKISYFPTLNTKVNRSSLNSFKPSLFGPLSAIIQKDNLKIKDDQKNIFKQSIVHQRSKSTFDFYNKKKKNVQTLNYNQINNSQLYEKVSKSQQLKSYSQINSQSVMTQPIQIHSNNFESNINNNQAFQDIQNLKIAYQKQESLETFQNQIDYQRMNKSCQFIANTHSNREGLAQKSEISQHLENNFQEQNSVEVKQHKDKLFKIEFKRYEQSTNSLETYLTQVKSRQEKIIQFFTILKPLIEGCIFQDLLNNKTVKMEVKPRCLNTICVYDNQYSSFQKQITSFCVEDIQKLDLPQDTLESIKIYKESNKKIQSLNFKFEIILNNGQICQYSTNNYLNLKRWTLGVNGLVQNFKSLEKLGNMMIKKE